MRVCQVKCVSLYFFLTGSFQSCRFCMPESILFILKNACLHLVIHGQLVANQCPVGYRAAIPFFIQFHNPQVECLAYMDNTLSSIPLTSFVRLGIAFGLKLPSLSLGTETSIFPYAVLTDLWE